MVYFIVILITTCAATMLLVAAITAPLIGYINNKENTDERI